MTNVIKVRLKKIANIGFAGLTTRTLEAGTEGFVVDAAPVVRGDKLTADILVLFPSYEHAAMFTIDELEVVAPPPDRDDTKLGLVHLIADMVELSFQMHENGVDLSFLSSMRRKQADKANDPPTS